MAFDFPYSLLIGQYPIVIMGAYIETASSESKFTEDNDTFGDSRIIIDAFELLLDCADGGGRKLALFHKFLPIFYCCIFSFCFNSSEFRNQ